MITLFGVEYDEAELTVINHFAKVRFFDQMKKSAAENQKNLDNKVKISHIHTMSAKMRLPMKGHSTPQISCDLL